MKRLFMAWLVLVLALSPVLPMSLTGQASEQETGSVVEQMELEVSQSLLSLTEVRTVDVTFEAGELVNLEEMDWNFGGKSLSEWKKWDSESSEYSGESFIQVVEDPHYVDDTTVEATLRFDLPYDTEDLSPRTIRVLYPELMGEYELALVDPESGLKAATTVKLNVYDEFLEYDEIKPAIDNIFLEANDQNDRFLEYKSLGESVEGRDIHFVVLARDEEAVTNYLDEMLPTALEDPADVLEKLENGTAGDYQIPIWFNNIHPDEVEGVDAQVELLKKFALENEVTFHSTDEDGEESVVTFDVDDVLDDVIFLFNFTTNPDGRVANTRANANGFDLNRDNAYQTQVETIAVNEEIAKWTPLSFIDMHGYVEGFLIEPGTPPHNPNFEYDLLIESMMEQAHEMGRTGVANSDLESYFIPLTDWGSGWDDMTPAYTAIFAMLHGSLGHTVEVPTLSQDSLYAMEHVGIGATKYVIENKDELFKKQLEIFKRGVNSVDDRAVDEWFVNADGEEIGRVRGDNENFFPEYYVIPFDEDRQKNKLEANEMVDYLIRNGVQVEKTTTAVTVAGTTYEEGTYIVSMNQAKRGFANAMLYTGDNVSDWDAMYDPIVVNFPALRGFDADDVRVEGTFTGKTVEVETAETLTSDVDQSTDKQILSNSTNDVIKVVNNLLAAGKDVEVVVEESDVASQGDFIVSTNDLLLYASDYVFHASPLTDELMTETLVQPQVAAIGSDQNKFVLQQLGFELVDVEDADVVVDDTGAVDVSELSGKTYVGIGGRSLQAVEDASLLEGFDVQTTALSHEGLVKANMNFHLLTSGYQADELLYITTGSWISSVPAEAEVLATVVDTDDFYVAGWWPGHEGAKGQTLAFTTDLEDTTFTLFANELAFRAHTKHSYPLLANSIFASMVDDAEVQEPSIPANPVFPDVAESHWAQEQIESLHEAGVINGHQDGTFQPSQSLTRGQAAELMTKALDLEMIQERATPSFSDLSLDHYYEPFASAVKEAGVFSGHYNGTFGASEGLTREQMATVLVNAFDLEATGDDVTFTDASAIASYHQDDVKVLAQHGITTESEYRPTDSVTRAEFAAFLYRVLGNK
ncbi:M14 family metallopeptidase [Desertibacillus haloalkaliphilus]|uniref:M14 family metallopeptidase n=1 Tax=Desertibacillus haloalkaliphilus TaxID=1328930 RepID=UPI001C258798|nr:S-layer homology domain-containing protein [Desertibacillus haloalkaliphilus]MBU8908723.1 S-layer homology domain-containing protein [Desertibacillus haloalkaliphilus]